MVTTLLQGIVVAFGPAAMGYSSGLCSQCNRFGDMVIYVLLDYTKNAQSYYRVNIASILSASLGWQNSDWCSAWLTADMHNPSTRVKMATISVFDV